ncbi:low affinity immunoglobulin epsilon Fc receptor-like [Mizuhopecten yessoensis]|uniref:Collectin-12 n=1 Tax=Mizuhopecten yessoensis TaxID=6573 RepID=A0A210Q278_MIZYE|nr:low affinity immunoglobulin epsilon Fc receptor-like [Mizuhopecten yessoensis]OWF42779.1 Collectin-12 [Mizuhopecten yessoensis]
MAAIRTSKLWQNVALLFLLVCLIGQAQGQVLTPTHREENGEARREQHILMNIRKEVTAMVQKVREETVLPAIAMYSTQMYELSKSVANISNTFTNLSAQIEDFQKEINNRSVELTCSDESWVLFDDRCYHFSTYQSSWQVAKTACGRMVNGGRMAEATTEVINDVLKREARTRGDSYWIGGHDIITEARWEWDSTGAIIGYYDWGPDQPNNVRLGQDCLELLAKFQWRWNDRECENTNHFICETEARYRKVNN